MAKQRTRAPGVHFKKQAYVNIELLLLLLLFFCLFSSARLPTHAPAPPPPRKHSNQFLCLFSHQNQNQNQNQKREERREGGGAVESRSKDCCFFGAPMRRMELLLLWIPFFAVVCRVSSALSPDGNAMQRHPYPPRSLLFYCFGCFRGVLACCWLCKGWRCWR